jgi:hypothetical protein
MFYSFIGVIKHDIFIDVLPLLRIKKMYRLDLNFIPLEEDDVLIEILLLISDNLSTYYEKLKL